jgi:hypothetical protein
LKFSAAREIMAKKQKPRRSRPLGAVAGKLSLQREAALHWIRLILVIQNWAFRTGQAAFVIRKARHALKEIEQVRTRIDLGLIAGIMDGVGHSVFAPRTKSFECWCFTTVGHPRC